MLKKRTLSVVGLALAGVVALAGTASARECKGEYVTAEGSIAKLRDLGAYPNSLFAWRSAVASKFGGEWNSWRYAEDATVDCKEITAGGQSGWRCIRKAKPCKDTLNTVVEGAKQEVGKITADCKADPLSATGARKKTEKEAIEQANFAWEIDTKKKYGGDWAKLANASGADSDCRKVGGNTQCITVATPCKPK